MIDRKKMSYNCKALGVTFLAVIVVVAFSILAWDKHEKDKESKVLSEKNDSVWKSKVHEDLLMLKHEVVLNRSNDKYLYMKVMSKFDTIKYIVHSNKEM